MSYWAGCRRGRAHIHYEALSGDLIGTKRLDPAELRRDDDGDAADLVRGSLLARDTVAGRTPLRRPAMRILRRAAGHY
jgi:hypothetical protein